MLDVAILTIFPAAVAFAGATDLFTMTIPNRVSLALAVAFALLAPFAGLDPGAVLSHIAAGVLVLAIGVLLFIPGWIGGGDAKLAAAVALWLGCGQLIEYFVCVALFGGVLAVMLMAARSWPLPTALSTQTWAVRLHDRRSGIPYGVALAAGALLLYPHTHWFAVTG